MASLYQRPAPLTRPRLHARPLLGAAAAPVALALSRSMNSWRGLGAVVVGMTAQGFNAELKEFPEGWRVNFYPVGLAHSVVAGSAWEPTPWRAVQRAAWEALGRAEKADGR